MNKSHPSYLLLFMAVSTISGTLLALQSYWGAFFLALLVPMLIFRKSSLSLWLSCSFIFLSAFMVSNHQETIRITTLSPHTSIHNVTIDSIPLIDGNSLRGSGQLNGERIVFRYRIPSENQVEPAETLKPGLTCSISGKLEEPLQNSNPNQFNYKRYLYERGIHWVLQVDSFHECQTKGEWKYLLVQWRFAGLKFIESRFPSETVGVTQALVFGETSRVSEEMMNSYRALGIVHLLAISGLHVGLIFGMVYFILLRLGITRENSLWISVVFLLFYIVITGGAPPVIRASSMMIILILSRKSPFKISILDSLSIVFMGLLFRNPFLVFDIGFQLSFAVSFCLVLSSRSILISTASQQIQLFKVTVIAQLSSLPIIIFHFYEFSLIGFLTNLLFVPLFSFIVLPMALSTFFMELLVTGGVQWLTKSYGLMVKGIDAFASLLSGLPLNTMIVGKPHGLVIVCYVLLILNVFKNLESGVWRLPSTILFGFVLLHAAWNQFNPYGEVVFIDVGQGDSTLIDLPYNGGTYLIDTGGAIEFPREEWEKKTRSFTVGEDVILPFLKSKGITGLDKLILTHGDVDHIGGTEELIENIKINEILITPNSQEKKEMMEIISIADKKGIPVKEVQAPYGWEAKHHTFHILSPQDDDYEGNNDSLVVYSELGGLEWLFTGDLEEKGEREFVDSYDIDASVLKIGHHGSDTSTSEEFLEEIGPSVAVISAGRNNRFGHPHPDVIRRLKNQEVMIHTTAEHGALTYRFLGKQGTFSAQLP
ncbi:DNA internalization-related competence protein ComEC/Rec2 [Bacillus sp. Marseille-Q1617]|uniref:DNA internalization-related competence protein ComEC/Rec2 n=1 Tax=Bacillus sp. Marseille-Q1617 TaxID=2736887 RepID=UPI00158EA5EE|nr:DNA internalization-related competence protein ComEC/Rec2 [Bacillus sp. Marseille-Q1617]